MTAEDTELFYWIEIKFEDLLSDSFIRDKAFRLLKKKHSKASLDMVREIYTRVIDTLLVPSIPPTDDYVLKLTNVPTDEFNDEEYIDVSLFSPSEGKGYSMDFVPWESLSSMGVTLGEDTSLSKTQMLSELLWEITFWGFSPEDVEGEKKKLLASLKASEQGEGRTFSSWEEFKKEFDE